MVALEFVGIKPDSEVLHAQHAVPVNDRREKRVVDFALGVLCGEDAVTAGDVPNGCRVTGEERPTFEIGAECIGILLQHFGRVALWIDRDRNEGDRFTEISPELVLDLGHQRGEYRAGIDTRGIDEGYGDNLAAQICERNSRSIL